MAAKYMALFVWAKMKVGAKWGHKRKGYLGIGGGRRST